jgi:hypothetical protein
LINARAEFAQTELARRGGSREYLDRTAKPSVDRLFRQKWKPIDIVAMK